jgi:hypothetical protein
MEGVCGMQEVRRGTYIVLVEKYNGKRPLGKPWSRGEDTVKWVFKKSFGMEWTAFIGLKTGSRDNKPSSSINCGDFLG